MRPPAFIRAAAVVAIVPGLASRAVATGDSDLDNPRLVALLEDVENKVNDLAVVAEASYKAWACGADSASYTIADCYVEMCKDRLTNEQCSSADDHQSFGGCGGEDDRRVLDFQQSAILSKVDPSRTTPYLKERIQGSYRWSSALDAAFQVNQQANDQLSWQYIGTPDGVFRSFPAHASEKCYDYDPRIRSWYVAATSGPKDVVITIDVSGSMMQQNRLELAKEAVVAVLNTLDQKDTFAVVLFSDRAKQLCGSATVTLDTRTGEEERDVDIACNGQLVEGTVANRAAMIALVHRDMAAIGGTKFNTAFDTSFSILRKSQEVSTGCKTPAILFLTDGMDETVDIKKIEAGRNALQADVGKLPAIFTFSLGSGADTKYVRQIACDTDGVWSPVADGGDLRSQMAHYYDYFAQLHTTASSEVTWVEEYLDSSGAGWMTTASKAVYDDSTKPPTLIGVVSIDVLIETLQEAANTAGTDLLQALAKRNSACIDISADKCSLEAIRGKDYGATQTSSSSRLLTGGRYSQAVENEQRYCSPDSATECGNAGLVTCGNGVPATDIFGPGNSTASTATAVTLQTITKRCTEERDSYDQVCDEGECASSDNKLSGGEIFAIVFCVLLIIGGIAFGVWFFMRRRAQQQADTSKASIDQVKARTSNDKRSSTAAPPPSYGEVRASQHSDYNAPVVVPRAESSNETTI